MVKWLEELTVTEAESDNHYHYFDNRVLPSHVDEKLAHEEGEMRRPGLLLPLVHRCRHHYSGCVPFFTHNRPLSLTLPLPTPPHTPDYCCQAGSTSRSTSAPTWQSTRPSATPSMTRWSPWPPARPPTPCAATPTAVGACGWGLGQGVEAGGLGWVRGLWPSVCSACGRACAVLGSAAVTAVAALTASQAQSLCTLLLASACCRPGHAHRALRGIA